jgi:hypothetical protein
VATVRAPAGLGVRGRSFWRSTVDTFDLERDEVELLAEVCRCLDEIDLMRDVLAQQGATVTGSRGQVRPHPLLAEIRSTRLLVARLLGQIGLPDEAGKPSVATPKSARARHAAASRWGVDRGTA